MVFLPFPAQAYAHASRSPVFIAVRTEQFRIMVCAYPRNGNTGRRHSRFHQLLPVDLPQVQPVLPVTFSHKAAFVIRHLVPYHVVHFVTTATDRRADSCQKVFRSDAKHFGHGADRFFSDLRSRSPPACMSETDGSRFRIGQKHRNSISIK